MNSFAKYILNNIKENNKPIIDNCQHFTIKKGKVYGDSFKDKLFNVVAIQKIKYPSFCLSDSLIIKPFNKNIPVIALSINIYEKNVLDKILIDCPEEKYYNWNYLENLPNININDFTLFFLYIHTRYKNNVFKIPKKILNFSIGHVFYKIN